jgi:hypothetical protein
MPAQVDTQARKAVKRVEASLNEIANDVTELQNSGVDTTARTAITRVLPDYSQNYPAIPRK